MFPRLCPSCVHWNLETDTCKAFPRGVPLSIMLGADHRRPIAGDGGVVFEQKEGEQAAQNLQMWKKTVGPQGKTTGGARTS